MRSYRVLGEAVRQTLSSTLGIYLSIPAPQICNDSCFCCHFALRALLLLLPLAYLAHTGTNINIRTFGHPVWCRCSRLPQWVACWCSTTRCSALNETRQGTTSSSLIPRFVGRVRPMAQENGHWSLEEGTGEQREKFYGTMTSPLWTLSTLMQR